MKELSHGDVNLIHFEMLRLDAATLQTHPWSCIFAQNTDIFRRHKRVFLEFVTVNTILNFEVIVRKQDSCWKTVCSAEFILEV